MAIIYIVILIGVLVFVHEFGHFAAARLFNVKVLNFSIGFGPRLFGKKIGDTSWDVRALPLGGYVQMSGSEFEEVTDREDPDFARAYNNKPIWQKAIINLAGPLFNLLLPIPLLFIVYFATATQDLPPMVGQVLDNTPAQGVLEPGDKVLQIDGKPIKFWTDLHKLVIDKPGKKLQFIVDRDGKELAFVITPETTVLRDMLDITSSTVGRIGITPDLASAVIGVVDPKGEAALAGLKSFDELRSINGISITNWVELEHAIRHHQGGELRLVVLRPKTLDLNYGRMEVLEPLEIRFDTNAKSLQDLGLDSANMFISQVDEHSPAWKAGMREGDQILELDGQAVNLFRSFMDKLVQTWEDPHQVLIRRNGEDFMVELQLEKLTITGEFQEEMPMIYSGFYHRSRMVQPTLVDRSISDRLVYAAQTSVNSTVKASSMLVIYVVRIFQGRVSTKSLGGPIMIGHMASKAGQDGIEAFLRMLAIISINLGILNLLPIPLLDGGKLAILAVEAVKRGPLSMRTRQIIAYIGLAMVALLMMLAFKNDIERLWNMFFS